MSTDVVRWTWQQGFSSIFHALLSIFHTTIRKIEILFHLSKNYKQTNKPHNLLNPGVHLVLWRLCWRAGFWEVECAGRDLPCPDFRLCQVCFCIYVKPYQKIGKCNYLFWQPDSLVLTGVGLSGIWGNHRVWGVIFLPDLPLSNNAIC